MSTNANTVEQLLARVLAYLDGMDLVISLPHANRALALVQQAVGQQEQDPFVYVMEQLPLHFALQPLELPPLSPPLSRGSIGYPR